MNLRHDIDNAPKWGTLDQKNEIKEVARLLQGEAMKSRATKAQRFLLKKGRRDQQENAERSLETMNSGTARVKAHARAKCGKACIIAQLFGALLKYVRSEPHLSIWIAAHDE